MESDHREDPFGPADYRLTVFGIGESAGFLAKTVSCASDCPCDTCVVFVAFMPELEHEQELEWDLVELALDIPIQLSVGALSVISIL